MRADERDFVDKLKTLVKIEDFAVVRQALEGVKVEDLAEGFQRLEHDEAIALLKRIPDETAAEVLVELPTETARSLAQELPDRVVTHFIDILPADDAVELRDDLGHERFETLLHSIPRHTAAGIRRLMGYPEHSVGRVMSERFFVIHPEMSIGEILADIRKAKDEKYETVNDLYVVDEAERLLGVFSLRKAIRASPDSTARDLMRTDIVTCKVSDAAEEAARQMARYGFYALPVVDEVGRIVGIFTGDDAQEILREAETEDVLKLGGVSGDVEAYLSLNVAQLVRRRLPWLMFLFVAETLTGSVMRMYVRTHEGVSNGASDLATIAQLTLFVPLLIGAGGNAGSQVTTTITRALAVGEIKTSDAVLVLRRELMTAVLMGTIIGTAGFLRAYFGWQSGWAISSVVGFALPAIIIWATTVGSVLPLGAKRMGVDPAVMSAPFITTFVDATGLVIFFEIARRVLHLHF